MTIVVGGVANKRPRSLGENSGVVAAAQPAELSDF